MRPRELHVMRAALDEDRQTMRYTCIACDRCVEDGPEGLRVLSRGDTEAVHQGGSLMGVGLEVEADLPPTPPTLH